MASIIKFIYRQLQIAILCNHAVNVLQPHNKLGMKVSVRALLPGLMIRLYGSVIIIVNTN
jgi:hypothetical protein